MTYQLATAAQQFLDRSPFGLFVDGKLRELCGSQGMATFDPSTGREVAVLTRGGAQDVDRAVAAARAARTGAWAAMTPARRSQVIWRIADAIEEHAEELAQLESLESGKPISVVRSSDIPGTAEVFRYYAGWPTKVTGSTVPLSRPDHVGHTVREPIGVCGLIVPWNYPLQMTAWKVAPALAAGCTMVLKPSEFTSLTALRLAELASQAGVPDGVLNVVTGLGPEAGAALAEHPDVDKVAFTGSPAVGRSVLAQSAATNLKHVSLELGGKSPHIVFADADLEAAMEGAANGIFSNMGQNCTAGSRVFVQRPVYDAVVNYLADAADGLVVGPGLDARTQIGPLVNAAQRDRVAGYIDTGLAEGARRLTDATLPVDLDPEGFYVRPTVFADAHNDMRVCQEEIFGPVVCVLPFTSEDEVVELANGTPYGLAAGIWTNDLSRAHRLVPRLSAGVVWVNTYNSTDPGMPFGGYGQSGIGRELGREGVEAFLETKSVVINVAAAR
jgi:acyl-CoA reductase-like NAD-dependent aldehyde dehydrogenase